jgi:hypothetical protein
MYYLMKGTVFFKFMGILGYTSNGDLLRDRFLLKQGLNFGNPCNFSPHIFHISP